VRDRRERMGLFNLVVGIERHFITARRAPRAP